MRQGFTLTELMVASAISMIVMSAVFVAFGSIWTMMKESNDELQLALHARSVRERVLYRLDRDHAGCFYAKIRSDQDESVTASSITLGVEQVPASDADSDENVAGSDSAVPIIDTIALPDNDAYAFVRDAKPIEGNVFDHVYPSQFIENGSSSTAEPSLFRFNLEFPADARRKCVYEEHLIVYVDGKVGAI